MRISKGLISAYSAMGQKGAFSGVGMTAAAEKDARILCLVADSVAIASLDRFAKLFPERLLNVGIAEQNLIGTAAGIASENVYTPYAFTYSAFLVLRAAEQIRQNLSYNRFNVKLVGNSAGFAMGPLGASHWALEDIALIKAIPGIRIFSPADSLEAVKLALALPEIEGPAYVRLSGGMNCPIVYDADFDYVPGRANVLARGTDAALIATGLMVREALDAARILEEAGVSCTVIDMHTVEPLDTDCLAEAFCGHALVASLEEHRISGGMGASILEYKNRMGYNAPLLLFGADKTYARLGAQRYIWEQYGLTKEQIAQTILDKRRSM